MKHENVEGTVQEETKKTGAEAGTKNGRATFRKRFAQLQSKMNVPKSHRNDFGKYNYRTVDDVFAEFKKHQDELSLILLIDDELFTFNDNSYIKSTASVLSADSDDVISADGYSLIQLDKKGMDNMQVMGAVSTYARKIALNGLLCLSDDENDIDGKTVCENCNNPMTPNRAESSHSIYGKVFCSSDCGKKILGEKEFAKITDKFNSTKKKKTKPVPTEPVDFPASFDEADVDQSQIPFMK